MNTLAHLWSYVMFFYMLKRRSSTASRKRRSDTRHTSVTSGDYNSRSLLQQLHLTAGVTSSS